MLICCFLKLISQVFHKIERILFEKCHNTSRPSCHEIRQVFVDKPLESYKPSGEEGSRVDLFSSISLINRYINVLFLANICYSLARRSLSGKTVAKVLSMAHRQRQRAILKSEGTVFSNTTDLPRVMNISFIYF